MSGNPYLHERDVPPISADLGLITTFQSADGGIYELDRAPLGDRLRCPCKAQHAIGFMFHINDALYQPELNITDLRLKKFFFCAPQVYLIVTGGAVLCPSCLVLYYYYD